MHELATDGDTTRHFDLPTLSRTSTRSPFTKAQRLSRDPKPIRFDCFTRYRSLSADRAGTAARLPGSAPRCAIRWGDGWSTNATFSHCEVPFSQAGISIFSSDLVEIED